MGSDIAAARRLGKGAQARLAQKRENRPVAPQRLPGSARSAGNHAQIAAGNQAKLPALLTLIEELAKRLDQEIAMSNFDNNLRDPVNQNGLHNGLPPRRNGMSSPTFVGAAIIVVLVLIGVGYAYNDRSGTRQMATHPTATSSAPAPATTPPAAPATPSKP